jgi:hypothetical protein
MSPTTSPTVILQDGAGGVKMGIRYVYRVTAVKSGGIFGWNTVRWRAPVMVTGVPVATVSGSTVTVRPGYLSDYGSVAIRCDHYTFTPPVKFCDAISGGYFTVQASFGQSIRKSTYGYTTRGVQFMGVPQGTHTFTVSFDWSGIPGYVIPGGSTTATVKP